MSLEEKKSTGYVKFVWSARISTFPETIYSDNFQIENLKNVTFNIGLKYDHGLTNIFTLWVKKSSSEVASALIKVTIGDGEANVETNDWKDLQKMCSLPKYLAIPQTVKTQQLYDQAHRQWYYSYEITITCEIFWRSEIKSNLNNNLYNEMQKFYNSEELSDVTIIVDTVKIPAHKVVLAAQSEVFSKMLQSGMKEAINNEINIKGLDPEIILEMLHYCYKGETKASKDTKVALQMLEVADIYQVIKLKDICESTLMKNMSTDNIIDIVDAADDQNAFDLRKSAINFIALHSKTVVASKKFQRLCYRKPDLMFELTCAFGNK